MSGGHCNASASLSDGVIHSRVCRGRVLSELVNGLVAVGALIVLSVLLYRPRVQALISYQATVVPLANFMDVGFIVMSPVIVVLIGYTAPLFMLGLCLLAIANGFAISYNTRHYEPLIGLVRLPMWTVESAAAGLGGRWQRWGAGEERSR